MPTKFLLADDHVLFREGLRLVLEEFGADNMVIEASDLAEAMAAVQVHPDIDLVLLDLSMPGMEGLAGIQALRRVAPDLPVVVLTASEETRHVRRALECGARGYITKSSSSEAMLAGIRTALSGETYVSPAVAAAGDGIGGEVAGTLGRLTRRQVEVLEMLRRGKSNKEIGRELGLAEITVKLHVTAILRVLDVRNRTQAALLAEKLGL